MTRQELASRSCAPMAVASDRLTGPEITQLLTELPGWSLRDASIAKEFDFDNYDQTMAFVNGVAWLSQRENHHPEVGFGYKHCHIAYSTHDVGGISLNDFICAAKVELLRTI